MITFNRHFRLLLILLTLTLSVPFSYAKKSSDNNTKYYLERAREAYGEGDLESALGWLARGEDEDPENPLIHIFKTSIYQTAEMYGPMLASANDVIKYTPKKEKEGRAIGYGSRGFAYVNLGDTVKALQDFDECLRLMPDSHDVLLKRAYIYSDLERWDDAVKDCEAAIKYRPGDIEGYQTLAGVEYARHNYDAALKNIDFAINIDPTSEILWITRAIIKSAKQDYRGATEDVLNALEVTPTMSAFQVSILLPKEYIEKIKGTLKLKMIHSEAEYEWPMLLALYAENDRDWKLANDYYKKVLALRPEPTIYDSMASNELRLGDFDRAMDYIREALASSDVPAYVVTKSDILLYMGRFGEAAAEINVLLKDDPTSIDLHTQLLNIYLNEKNFEKVIEEGETLKLLSSDPAFNQYLDFFIADAYRNMGDEQKAKEFYAKVVEQGDSAVERTQVPMSLASIGKVDEAFKKLEIIMAEDSIESDTHSNLYNQACLYARVGKKSDALDTLEKYLAESKDAVEYAHALFDYDLDSLRDEPRYKEIMEKYNPAAGIKREEEEPGEASDVENVTENVPFTYEAGVTKVRCEINGLPLYFVFDTGASDVTLSAVEANFMLKNNYISPKDFIGTERYIDANGDISEGALLNLKNVNFAGFSLDNVRASVVKNQRAPLLLGQSVLGRLGKIEIDNSKKLLKITHTKNEAK